MRRHASACVGILGIDFRGTVYAGIIAQIHNIIMDNVVLLMFPKLVNNYDIMKYHTWRSNSFELPPFRVFIFVAGKHSCNTAHLYNSIK